MKATYNLSEKNFGYSTPISSPVERTFANQIQTLVTTGIEITKAYQKSRLENGEDIIERPIYYIDIVKPLKQIEIQSHFDIQREARHLSTKILNSRQVQEYRMTTGRCFYYGSPHMTEEISIAREVEELSKLGDQGAVCPVMLPEKLAELFDRTKNGLPKQTGSQFWLGHQLCLGNLSPQDAISLENRRIANLVAQKGLHNLLVDEVRDDELQSQTSSEQPIIGSASGSPQDPAPAPTASASVLLQNQPQVNNMTPPNLAVAIIASLNAPAVRTNRSQCAGDPPSFW